MPLLLANLVAACAVTVEGSPFVSPTPTTSIVAPTASPTPNATPTPTAPPTPVVTPNPTVAGATQAVAITESDAGGRRLMVELVSPDKPRRNIATLVLGAEAEGLAIRQAALSPTVGVLMLWATPADVEFGHGQGSILLYDLERQSDGPVVLPASSQGFWGPTGRLAFGRPDGSVAVYDPVRAATVLTIQAELSFQGWAADGSGVLVARHDGATGPSTVGMMGDDGVFVAGFVEPYTPTGADRFVGSAGMRLSVGHGDPAPGGQGANFISIDRPDLDESEFWYTAVWDVDPQPIAITFDRSGTGLWVLLDAGSDLRLAHLPAAEVVDVRASLPDPFDNDEDAQPLTIVAISPDEAVVLLQQPAGQLRGAADLYWLDLATDSRTKLEGWFVGWSFTRP